MKVIFERKQEAKRFRYRIKHLARCAKSVFHPQIHRHQTLCAFCMDFYAIPVPGNFPPAPLKNNDTILARCNYRTGGNGRGERVNRLGGQFPGFGFTFHKLQVSIFCGIKMCQIFSPRHDYTIVLENLYKPCAGFSQNRY